MNIDLWNVLLLVCIFQLGVLYGRWRGRTTAEKQAEVRIQEACDHNWCKVGAVDWECVRCGKHTDGWPDTI